MKAAARVFFCLSLLVSHAMCATVAFSFANALWAQRHHLTSAPAWIAFLWLIPFCLVLGICLALALIFHKKSKKGN